MWTVNMHEGKIYLSRLVDTAKLVIITLLVLELLLIYGLGYLLSGALGEANDAKGLILLVGPVSVVVNLIIIWRFGKRLSVWIMALAVLTGPFWASFIFGPASERNFWPFWAQLAVVTTWPIWGLIPLRSSSQTVTGDISKDER